MSGRDGFEGCLEVGAGLHAIHPGRLDQRGDASPGGRPFFVASEQRVLSREGRRTDPVLHGIGVQLDPPVFEEHPQSVSVAGDIVRGLAESGLGRGAGPLLLDPEAELVDQRRSARYGSFMLQVPQDCT